MATTTGQHQLTAFTTPVNGTSPIDADEVRTNDATIRTAYNAHDSDTGIHVQSSVIGSRPAAGTSGRKWLTVDALSAPTSVRAFYDDGTNWYELSYLSTAGGTVAGNLSVTGTVTATLGFISTASGITAVLAADGSGAYVEAQGANSLRFLTDNVTRVTIGAAGGLTVASGGMAVTGNSTITGSLGGITGLTVASGGASIAGGGAVTGTWAVTGTLTATTGLTVSGGGAAITGDSTLAANSRLAVGGAVEAGRSISVYATTGADASKHALSIRPTFNSSTTTLASALTLVGTTDAASFTCPSFSQLLIGNNTFGAGSTVTDYYGINIVAVDGATNCYGVYVGTVSGGTLSYAIYTAGGNVNFQSLPTSAAGLAAGTIWNNSGVLNIV